MARTKTFNQEEVLDKAVELFWTKGYNATSANDLVKELGLSRSSLYDTYGDKRSLYIQSMQRYRSEFAGKMIQMIEGSEDIKKTIHQIFMFVIEQDFNRKVPKGCFMVNSAIELATCDVEISEIVKANHGDIVSAFEKALEKGKSQRQIAEKLDSMSLAQFFYNSITGIRVSIKYSKSKKSIEDIVRINMSVLDS